VSGRECGAGTIRRVTSPVDAEHDAAGLTEPRWRRRPESRRDELLDAAQRSFIAQGVESTTVADIVKAAGLAKGSFYRYFTSKDDLFGALKGRLFERMGDQLDQAVAGAIAANPVREGSPSPQRFGAVADAIVDTSIRFLLAEADLISVWSREARPARELVLRQGLQHLVERFEKALNLGISRGVVHCRDPRRTARLIVLAVQAAAHDAILTKAEGDPGPLIAATQVMVRRTLGLPDPPDPAD
jgi:AcrR family transcriptional regulator